MKIRRNVEAILLTILFFTVNICSQQIDSNWKLILQPNDPARNVFGIIKCSDSLNCFIFSSYGGVSWGYNIRRTTDGGKSWDVVYGDTSKGAPTWYKISQIRDIAYPDTNLFIAVGDSGTVIRTTDRGKSWEKKIIDKNFGLYKFVVLNKDYFIVSAASYVESGQMFLESNDKGVTWKKIKLPELFTQGCFNAMYMINKDLIYAIRYHNCQNQDSVVPVFLRISNNWQTWDTVHLNKFLNPKSNLPVNYQNLYFINDNEGWICGGRRLFKNDLWTNQLIMHTTDAGANWEVQRDTNLNYFGPDNIKFVDKDYGMCEGGPYTMLMTSNGGKIWEEHLIQDYDSNNKYSVIPFSLQMPDRNSAYLISTTNVIYKYTGHRPELNDYIEELPKDISDYYCYPNPFSDATDIIYQLETADRVRLAISDIFGNEVAKLIEEYQPKGVHKLRFDVSSLPEGTYFCRMETPYGTRVIKLMKMKQ